MEVFEEYLSKISSVEHRDRMEQILNWVSNKFPNLEPRIAWNQPMFTDHGTFIIGFSVSKNHIALSPELAGINHFSEEIIKAGYTHTKMLMQIKWELPVDYSLIEKMIEFNILDKADCETFWR